MRHDPLCGSDPPHDRNSPELLSLPPNALCPYHTPVPQPQPSLASASDPPRPPSKNATRAPLLRSSAPQSDFPAPPPSFLSLSVSLEPITGRRPNTDSSEQQIGHASRATSMSLWRSVPPLPKQSSLRRIPVDRRCTQTLFGARLEFPGAPLSAPCPSQTGTATGQHRLPHNPTSRRTSAEPPNTPSHRWKDLRTPTPTLTLTPLSRTNSSVIPESSASLPKSAEHPTSSSLVTYNATAIARFHHNTHRSTRRSPPRCPQLTAVLRPIPRPPADQTASFRGVTNRHSVRISPSFSTAATIPALA
jgi:hypothetical protein